MDNNIQKNLSVVELLAKKEQLLNEVKCKIASLCHAIVQSPEENIAKVRELRSVLYNEDYGSLNVVRGYVLVSLCEVFKDIIPSYKIRPPTDKEKAQKMKKDMKYLRGFEETLLLNYRKYLDILSFICKKNGKTLKKQLRPSKNEDFTRISWSVHDKETAIKCACQLYQTHPAFNYSEDLISLIVPFLDSNNQQVSGAAISAVEQCLKEDKNGDVSLRCCRAIRSYAKKRHYEIRPQVIRVFLVMNIREIQADDSKKKTLKYKEKMQKWSRKQRRKDKLLSKFNHDMEELKLSQTREVRLKLNTHIIKEIFHLYFKVLKQRQSSILLSAVLEGLSKFAHLINLDLVDDLFGVLNEIVEKQEVSVVDSLHCVHTAVTMITGQGCTLDIDPARFYAHLYTLLPRLDTTNAGPDVIERVVDCLDLLLIKRKKQVSINRVLAFVKRLASSSLHQTPEGSATLMAALIRYLRHFPRSEVLFDSEAEVGGPYNPDVPDPEMCYPGSAVLWELELLRKHTCPEVAALAQEALRIGSAYHRGNGDSACRLGGGGGVDLARLAPKEVREAVDKAYVTFMESEPAKVESKNKKRRAIMMPQWCVEDAKRLCLDVSDVQMI